MNQIPVRHGYKLAYEKWKASRDIVRGKRPFLQGVTEE
jgi:hypothetical protein